MEELFIGREHVGKTLVVSPETNLVIRLEENPTTGYRWSLASDDDSVVAAVGDDYSVGTGAGIGGGGVRTFTLSAKGQGETRISLKHWRDWEGDESIIEKLDFTIVVK